jgi:hypothetical protein
VTQDHARKKAIRARMEYRTDLQHLRHPDEYRPGPVGRFVISAVKLARERVVPERARTSLLEARHQVSVGIVEPAAGRYQMVRRNGYPAKMYIDGEHFFGFPGKPLEDRDKDGSVALHRDDPLAWLRLLLGVTQARYAGDETLRGTPCRKVILSKILLEMSVTFRLSGSAEEDPAEFTVWIDEDHVRQVMAEVTLSDHSGLETKTLELWDFGVPVDSLDWTRFPE